MCVAIINHLASKGDSDYATVEALTAGLPKAGRAASAWPLIIWRGLVGGRRGLKSVLAVALRPWVCPLMSGARK